MSLLRPAPPEPGVDSTERRDEWQLFDRVPIGLVRWELDETLIAANPLFLNLVGYPDAAALGSAEPGEVLLEPTLLDLSDAALAGRYGPHSCLIRRRDGSTFEGRAYVSPVTLADGRTVVEGALEDVTFTNWAQRSVRDLRHRYRDIFTVSPIALWEESFAAVEEWAQELRASGVEDLRGYLAEHPSELVRAIGMIEILEVNAAAVSMVGAAGRADLIGPMETDWATMADDARESFVEQIVAVWKGRTRLSIDLEGSTVEGQPIDVTLNWAAPVHDGRPDYSHVVVAIADQTARRQRERAVESENETLSELYEVLRRLLGTLDLDDALRILCEETHRALRATRCAVLLRTEGESAPLRGADTNPPPGGDGVTVARDGIIEWVLSQGVSTRVADVWSDPRHGDRDLGSMFRPEDGPGLMVPLLHDDAPVGVVGVLRNRGDQPFTETDEIRLGTIASIAVLAIVNAKLHQETKASRDELELVVEELGRTQAKLVQAQRLEAIGELAAGIAHEINTPIQYVGDNTRFLGDAASTLASVATAALSLAEAVRAGERVTEAAVELQEAMGRADLEYLLAEVPGAVAQSVEGIARVADIVRALREFAHPGELHFAPVDLNRAIETTIAVSRNEWRFVAELETDLDPDLPEVGGLSGPLNQVILNLIVNAAHAVADTVADGERGTITITSRTGIDEVEVAITDSGCGIPPGLIRRIFDPFFTTKDVGKGSGQGLAIAHHVIVEQHHGHLEVESEPGLGTTFRIWLPISQGSEEERR